MRTLLIGCLTLLLAVTGAGVAVGDDTVVPGGDVRVEIHGEPRLGGTLTAEFDWAGLEPDPYPYYLWLADGEPIDRIFGEGTAREAFTLNTSTFGKQITVEVIVHFEGRSSTIVSPPVGPVGSGQLEVQAYLKADTDYTGDPVYAVPWTASNGASYTYQWFADGQPVPGATSNPFRPAHGLVGKKISARVTASANGWIDGTTVTGIGQPLEPGWLPDDTHIEGTPEVGETVSAQFTNFGGAEELDYRWSVDGTVLGTRPSFEIGPELVGKTLKLTSIVTLRKKSTTFQDEVVVVASTRRTPAPQITGSAVVGWNLTAHVEPWNPRPLREMFQWYRTVGGVTRHIDGATGSVYRLTREDLGARITVRRIAEMPPLGSLTTADSAPTAAVAFNVYTTPGEHTVSGRQWRTSCEPYSQTMRCRTEIQVTRTVRSGSYWHQETAWVFNNLTYLPSARALWKNNPLGTPGDFNSGGRTWRTECDTAATGRNACRTYLRTMAVTAKPRPGGGYTYSETPQWVFNNIVNFG